MPGYKPKVSLSKSTNPWLSQLRALGTPENVLAPVTVKGTKKIPVSSIGMATPSNAAMAFKPSALPNTVESATKGFDWKGVSDKVTSTMRDLTPFISNIKNALTKPPKPKMGLLNDYINLKKVNMDADRNAVSREVNANTTQAYRNLDGNTATKVALQGMGTKLNAFSKISAAENNANSEISNRNTLANAQISQGNNATTDEYNTALVERKVAQQREQSANWANAGQKLTEIGNEKRKAQVSKDNTRTYAEAFKTSGVADAVRFNMMQKGLPDPNGLDYKDLDEKGVKRTNIFKGAYGGKIPKKNII